MDILDLIHNYIPECCIIHESGSFHPTRYQRRVAYRKKIFDFGGRIIGVRSLRSFFNLQQIRYTVSLNGISRQLYPC